MADGAVGAELRDTAQIDDEVRGWLAAAYANAG